MIIFAKTRWSYDSYTDFWKLVDLSGFPTCFVDQMDLYNPDNVYITTPVNGELRPFIDERKDRKATLFHWNLERPGDDTVQNFVNGNAEFVEAGYADAVIVSDDTLAAMHPCFKYVTLGSHESLGNVAFATEKLYDFIHLSCYSNRRSFMFSNPSKLKTRLWAYSVAPNGWGIERHNNMIHSRFMLCIHQDAHKFIEPLRFSLAAAYALPLISEEVYEEQYPYVNFGKFFSLADMSIGIQTMLEDYDTWWNIGIKFRESMTGPFSFRKCIESVI